TTARSMRSVGFGRNVTPQQLYRFGLARLTLAAMRLAALQDHGDAGADREDERRQRQEEDQVRHEDDDGVHGSGRRSQTAEPRDLVPVHVHVAELVEGGEKPCYIEHDQVEDAEERREQRELRAFFLHAHAVERGRAIEQKELQPPVEQELVQAEEQAAANEE